MIKGEIHQLIGRVKARLTENKTNIVSGRSSLHVID